MKEFIEKLNERLEESDFNDIQMVVREVLLKYGFPYESVVQDEVWDALDELSTNKFAIKIINRLAEEYINTSIDTSSGWIPCSERLPDISGEYLTYVYYDDYENKYYSIEVDEIDCDGRVKEWNRTIGKIVAWQPLPAPYKEGE